MKSMILRIAIIAVILIAGWIAVFNIPDTVESFLPTVETVTMTTAEYHQTVSGTGIITQDSDGWFVTISVGESDISQVEIGQSADISGAAFDDGIFTATVHAIDSLAVVQQGEYTHETVVEVVLQIDNPDTVKISGESGKSGESGGVLRPGYSARADIKTEQSKTIFTIPYSVILQDDIGEFVYVLSGNMAVRRDILTGVELAEGAQVLSGLNEKDEIIASPEVVEENALVKSEED